MAACQRHVVSSAVPRERCTSTSAEPWQRRPSPVGASSRLAEQSRSTSPEVGFYAALSRVEIKRSDGVHPGLLAHGRRVVRPRDAVDLYANPRAEFRRMADTGVLRRIATGYYAVVP